MNDHSVPTVDFYFDFVSPYGWIGAERIGKLASRFGRSVSWHPFLLKVTVLQTMGLPPPLETPLKGEYLLHDIKRCLRFSGLSMSPEATFGFSSVIAARAALWTRTAYPHRMEELVTSLYRAHWELGRDISNFANVLDVVENMGLPKHEVEEALNNETVKQALYDETSQAIVAGVFGSPTTIIDGEMFWGTDRFTAAERWMETGGW